MNQTRVASFIEALTNTFIGWFISLAGQLVIFPVVGIHVTLATNLEVSFWFTLLSIARGYLIRRWFNARIHQINLALQRAVLWLPGTVRKTNEPTSESHPP